MTATISGDGTSTLINLTTSGNTILGDASTDTLNVGNGGLVKDASGNVGIGTSTPVGKFDVGGASTATTNTTVYIHGTDNASYGQSIAFRRNGSNSLIIGDAGAILGSGGGASVFYTYGANYQAYYTNGSERMRIDSSGNLLVGTTSAGALANNNGTAIGPQYGWIIQNHVNGAASGTAYLYFGYNGNSIGTITQNGTTGVLYNLTSDYRLKNNQQPLTGAKDFVMALQPKKWQWWDGSGEGVGFVAHEFMEVAKHSGNGEKDAVDAEGKPVYQSIQPSSSEVMANLVSFIQEQQAIITALQADVAALKAQGITNG
jgi:hypothetical protein